MIEFFNVVLGFPTIILWCVVLHELGHLLYFKLVLGKDVMISFKKGLKKYRLSTGQLPDYEVGNHHLFNIYFSGVALGAMPLLVGLGLFSWKMMIWAVALYIFGSKKDVRLMIAAWRTKCS